MERIWEYPLITDEHSEDYHYEAPIILHGGRVYFAQTRIHMIDFHIIDSQTGKGCIHSFPHPRSWLAFALPHDYFAFIHKNRVIYYAGDLIMAEGGQIVRTMKLPEKVRFHLVCGNHLLVACDKLYGIDLDTFSIAWTQELTCGKMYDTGDLAHFGRLVSCYGQDQLLFIEPESGRITDSLRLPRIDKLYHPIALDNDTLLIGYTNWTNAGVLKYQRSTERIVWRHRRRFEGPQLNCRIWHEGNRVYWVKGETELICLSDETGEELFHLRTVPWLYTGLQFLDGCILYGTAGANGYINCLDARSGQMRWSAALKNGCEYYAVSGSTVLTGDFSKNVTRFSLRDGKVVDQLHLDGKVVGRIVTDGRHVYTVIWAREGKPVRLVRISLSQDDA